VYNAGDINLQAQLEVDKANFLQHSVSCPGGLTQDSKLTVPNGKWSCTTSPVPDPNPVLPSKTLLVPRTGPSKVTGNCSIWLPGKYTQPINLTNDNYFASGIYYFNGAPISVGDANLVGGQPGPGESTIVTSMSPCANDAQAGDANNGTGVEFILGGNSTISVGKGSFELYSRRPPTSAGTSEGTPGLSIRTVPPAPPSGYDAWSLGATGHPTDYFLSTAMGNHAHMALHGFVYAPNASAQLYATNGVQAYVLGGFESYDVALQSSASGSGLVISVDVNSVTSTDVVLTSTARGGTSDKTVTTTAVAAIGNDVNRAVNVQSWTTENQ
jgi:hypothetical protein